MSRGYGWLQSRLLSILEQHERTTSGTDRRVGLDTMVLAQHVHEREPTRSEVVSVRRALMALSRAGDVTYIAGYTHRFHWMTPRARKGNT